MRIGSFIFGPLHAGTPIDVAEVTFELQRLPDAFDGFRLALVSDLHYGSFVRAGFVRRVMELVATHAPDVLVLCGDLVDRPRHFTVELADMLGEISDQVPICAVMGNHDHHSGGRQFARIIRDAGVDVLLNESRLIRRGGAAIALVGLDDLIHGRMDYRTALADVDDNTCTIVASHNPDTADAIGPDQGVDLMLSGHTHGGQVCIFGIPLGRESRNPDYVSGVTDGPGFAMYITRGLGVTGVPVRFGSYPELPIIVLRSK